MLSSRLRFEFVRVRCSYCIIMAVDIMLPGVTGLLVGLTGLLVGLMDLAQQPAAATLARTVGQKSAPNTEILSIPTTPSHGKAWTPISTREFLWKDHNCERYLPQCHRFPMNLLARFVYTKGASSTNSSPDRLLSGTTVLCEVFLVPILASIENVATRSAIGASYSRLYDLVIAYSIQRWQERSREMNTSVRLGEA
jgi:hypothetical protein